MECFFSLQIQPSYIRSRNYVRNAKKDVCNFKPEILYWWRKSLLNPDRSTDWLTKQFCIISFTIIQCGDVQKPTSENYLVLPWKFFDSVFSLFVHNLFNVSSLKQSQFQAFYSERVFVNMLTGSAWIRQVANLSNGTTRPHVDTGECIGDSSVRF